MVGLAPGRGVQAVGVASLLLSAPALGVAVGRFGQPLVLLLVLPPLAVGLGSLGWGEHTAFALRRAISRPYRPAGLFTLWCITSAMLGLDAAAIVAADVGLGVAGPDVTDRTLQMRAAILGSNLGSLLFPFSNLTNLLLVAGTGLAFGTYVEAAAVPQLALVVAGVALMLLGTRIGRGGDGTPPARPTREPSDVRQTPSRAAVVGGLVAITGSVAAVIVGFADGDVAPVFAVTAAIVAALAVTAGSCRPTALGRSIPPAGVAIILATVAFSGELDRLVALLPSAPLGADILTLAMVAVAGGLLSAAFNNLPAAAFGALWLIGAGPSTVIAFLIGTNVISVLTPHGSLATMLSHSVAIRRGWPLDRRAYVRRGWVEVVALTAAAVLALTWFR